jgi:hypothetical protein
VNRLFRLPLFLWGIFVLPGSSLAGTITLGGDLLSESVATPMLLGSGEAFDLPFTASMPGVGMVRGTVHLGNEAALAGVIRLVDLQFQSLRPSGAGDVSFTLAAAQDFAYAGPPSVNGFFSLSASATLTAFPQSARGQVAGFLGVVLDPLPFGFTANPQATFPQVQEFNTTGGLQGLGAGNVMSLQLSLSLRLSDNAVSAGPRFEPPGGSGELVSIGYAAPISEAASVNLVSVLVLLGCVCRRRRASRPLHLEVPSRTGVPLGSRHLPNHPTARNH